MGAGGVAKSTDSCGIDIFAAGIFLKPIETKASVVDAGLGAAI